MAQIRKREGSKISDLGDISKIVNTRVGQKYKIIMEL